MLGTAYAILEFDFNETAFPNGLPNFTCVMRGARIYDPRDGLTKFTTNPALHARHLALHDRFGKRTSLRAREEARFIAAANACDTLRTIASESAAKAASDAEYAAKYAEAEATAAEAEATTSEARLAAAEARNADLLEIATLRSFANLSRANATTLRANATTLRAAANTAKASAAASTDQVKLYESSLVVPFGTHAADVLDDICQAMCGYWGYAGGEMFIKAGVYTAPVKTLYAYDLLTSQTDSQGGSNSYPIQISTHKARNEKLNSITAKIYDSGAAYRETTTEPVENGEAIFKDGIRLPLEVSMPAVFTKSQAQLVCNYMLKDSFDPMVVSARFKLSAYAIELFDNIALNIPRYGWDNKVFVVMGRNFNPSGSIELTLKETSAELFNPNIYSDTDGFATNTNLVEPWEIDPPEALTMSSGTSELLVQGDGTVVTRVRVQWPKILDERVREGGDVELWWKPTSSESSSPITVGAIPPGTIPWWAIPGGPTDPEMPVTSSSWSAITVPGVESSAYILGAVDGSTLVVKARTRTSLAVSDWNVQATHTVVGKTAPPGNVTGLAVTLQNQGLNLSWVKVSDLDLAGYEVRLVDSGWGDGREVYRGTSTAIQVSPGNPSRTWYVKAYDRSGNYSSLAAYTTFTRGDTPQVGWFNIAGDKLIWSTVTPQFGLAGYEIRYQNGADRPEWGTASPLHFGLLTSFPYTLPSTLKGVTTLLIKAVDSYNVYSVYPEKIITNLGDQLVKNVIESYDYKANSYPGALVNGSLSAGKLIATKSDLFYREQESDFYRFSGETFYSENYDSISWVSSVFRPSSAALGVEMFVTYTQESAGHTLEYRLMGPTPSDFLPWPGRSVAVNEDYQFRFSTLAGPVQGSLNSFSVSIDVDDKVVLLSDVAVSAAGTRLPVGGQFSSIQNVQLTLQGGTAVAAYVVDKNPLLGPLVYTKDNSGNPVASSVDATIQGY